tara:strand:+ start:1568 stop:2311 length:744 start_codon:yes stop_codon:yes gene_type:complete
MNKFFGNVKYEFSKQIFKNQSSLRSNLIDYFFSLGLKKDFKIIRGNVDILDVKFDEKKSDYRGHLDQKKHVLSKSYFTSTIPDFFVKIIKDNEDLIAEFLGKNFVTDKALFFRNYNIPEYLESHDIYSNIWHLDSGAGFKLLKIFVLIEDTNIDDGPFHFLERKDTINHWDQLRDRWSFDILKELKKFKEQQILTGKRGDYLILSTSTCMHRASIPSKVRDMAQITIYPKWCKKYYKGYNYLEEFKG